MKEHTQRIMKRCYSSYCKGMNPMDSVRFIPVVDIYWKPNVCTRLSKLNDKQYLSCGSFWEMFDYKHFTIDSFLPYKKIDSSILSVINPQEDPFSSFINRITSVSRKPFWPYSTKARRMFSSSLVGCRTGWKKEYS
ncbi:MAG: hypothetical protein IJM60_02010 [Bacteroidales bacterium]|nr:hypothetical protein [Bacteroidales bacterium]